MWYKNFLFYLILLAFTSFNTLFAQLPEITSRYIANYEKDTADVDGFLNKADSFLNVAPDSAYAYFNIALNKSRELQYSFGITQSLFSLGLEKQKEGYFKESLDFFKQAYPYCYTPHRIAQYYTNMGVTVYSMGNYAEAAFYFYNALRYAQNPRLLLVINSNLSGIWGTFGKPDLSYMYLKKAEFIALRYNSSDYLPTIYNNIAATLFAKKDYGNAYKYSQQALKLAERNHNILVDHIASNNIADILIEQGDYKRALIYVNRVINSREKATPYASLIAPNALLGKIYYHLNDYLNAEKYLVYSLQIANRYGIKNTINIHGLLVEIYEKEYNYKKALEHFEKNVAISDSILGIEKNRIISELELKYEIVEKDKNLLQKQVLISNKDKWIWVTSLSSIVFALGMTTILFFYRNNTSKRRLQEEKISALQKGQEIELLKATMLGEETERTRIGHELHDGIGGLLSAVKMSVSMLNNKPENHIESILLIDESIKELRKTSHNLMPEILLKRGLVDAIKDFCSRINMNKSTYFQVYTFGLIPKLEIQFSLSLYRIIQELINNIIKHANAINGTIHLNWFENSFIIIVEDDGIGLKLKKVKDDKGLGLLSIESRINALNGILNIEKGNSIGTIVYIEFPIN